ncbi:Fosmidomycin resistance protein, partial [Paenibacillus sp. Aloe-11]
MTTKSAAKKETGQSLPLQEPQAKGTVFAILIAISFVHLFNDSIQSVIPAIFPILKESMNL